MKKPDIFWFAFWMIITLATIFSGCKQPVQPVPPDEPEPNGISVRPITAEEQQLVNAHNEYRKQQGLGILTLNNRVVSAAQGHADWMATNDKMSHTGKNGSTLGARLKQAGYRYSYAGENIAKGYNSVFTVMQGWRNSTGHRLNMLNKNYQHIGVAVVKSKTGKRYWCVDFGRQLVGSEAAQEIIQNLPGGIEE